MKKATMIAFVLAALIPSAGAQEVDTWWHCWAAHEGHAYARPDQIRVETRVQHNYHWNKDEWLNQTGSKAYVSTNQYYGLEIEDALQSITYDVVDGNWLNVNFNIIVEDVNGLKAVVAPGAKTETTSGFIRFTVSPIYHILHAEPGWSGTDVVGPNVASWYDIKDLVISEGPISEIPDTLLGEARTQNDPYYYKVSNWSDWAEKNGMEEAEKDGVLLVFSHTTGPLPDLHEYDTHIENFQVNGIDVVAHSIPKVSSYDAVLIDADSAVLKGGVVEDGNSPCEYRFRYWRADDEVPHYTEWICCYQRPDVVSYEVENLASGITYNYVLELQNEYGWAGGTRVRSFKTLARLTISSDEGATVTVPGEGSFTYDVGTVVSINAIATGVDPFMQWHGTAVDAGLVADPYAAYTTVTAQGDHTLIALTQPYTPPGSLVAHYVFDGNAVDITGNGYDGFILGEPNFIFDSAGPGVGSALALDGQNDAVAIPRSIEEDWTMALWFRTDDPNRIGLGTPDFFGNGFGLLNGKTTVNYMDDFGLSFQARAISYGVGRPWDAGNTIVAYEAITDTEWHHIAATRQSDNGFMALYLDGDLAYNQIPYPNTPVIGFGPAGPKTAPTILMAGGIDFQWGKYLLGDLADMRLYTYVLDANEIASLAFNLEVGPMIELVAAGSPLTAWRFDGIWNIDLQLGTTIFAGPPSLPLYPAHNADNYDLSLAASAHNQAYMKTLFPVPVSQIYILEVGANDSGYFQALNELGEPIGPLVPFSPDDFLDTGYVFMGQKGGGLVINAMTPIYGVIVYPPDGGPLSIDPVCITGYPVN